MKYLITFILSTVIHAQVVDWPAQNAVAYQAKKTMFFFKSVDVVGLNSNIGFSKSVLNSGRIISLNIPLESFKTDDKDRDLEVQSLLGVKKQKYLTFTSEILFDPMYEKLQTGTLSSMKGKINIAGEFYAVKLSLNYSEKYLFAEIESKLSSFNIKPPKVALGVVAKAHDYIKLLARINRADL